MKQPLKTGTLYRTWRPGFLHLAQQKARLLDHERGWRERPLGVCRG